MEVKLNHFEIAITLNFTFFSVTGTVLPCKLTEYYFVPGLKSFLTVLTAEFHMSSTTSSLLFAGTTSGYANPRSLYFIFEYQTPISQIFHWHFSRRNDFKVLRTLSARGLHQVFPSTVILALCSFQKKHRTFGVTRQAQGSHIGQHHPCFVFYSDGIASGISSHVCSIRPCCIFASYSHSTFVSGFVNISLGNTDIFSL